MSSRIWTRWGANPKATLTIYKLSYTIYWISVTKNTTKMVQKPYPRSQFCYCMSEWVPTGDTRTWRITWLCNPINASICLHLSLLHASRGSMHNASCWKPAKRWSAVQRAHIESLAASQSSANTSSTRAQKDNHTLIPTTSTHFDTLHLNIRKHHFKINKYLRASCWRL